MFALGDAAACPSASATDAAKQPNARTMRSAWLGWFIRRVQAGFENGRAKEIGLQPSLRRVQLFGIGCQAEHASKPRRAAIRASRAESGMLARSGSSSLARGHRLLETRTLRRSPPDLRTRARLCCNGAASSGSPCAAASCNWWGVASGSVARAPTTRDFRGRRGPRTQPGCDEPHAKSGRLPALRRSAGPGRRGRRGRNASAAGRSEGARADAVARGRPRDGLHGVGRQPR